MASLPVTPGPAISRVAQLKTSDSVEAQVLRTAKAAGITPRRAALVLAERVERGVRGSRLGIGSPEADAAALRGLAQLYAGRAKRLVLDELRDEVQRIAEETSIDPAVLAVAMVRLIERGVVEVEPRAAVLDHLRRLAGDRLESSKNPGESRPDLIR